jgi:erythronate-4-phosphate dehydrogenase
VVEYVFAALVSLEREYEFDWLDKSFGIIGAGQVGGLLADMLEKIGVRYAIYDPFLESESRHCRKLASFADVIDMDVLSLHTPLTTDGLHPSYHLFDKKLLQNLPAGKVIINAARGAVIDNSALLERLASNDLLVVLDTWEQEPLINLELLEHVAIGTPHIAGYSQQGKLNGTIALLQALGTYLDEKVSLPECLSSREVTRLANVCEGDDIKVIGNCISEVYPLMQDAQALKLSGSARFSGSSGEYFDQLRKQYPVRKEFPDFAFSRKLFRPEVQRVLEALGFAAQD